MTKLCRTCLKEINTMDFISINESPDSIPSNSIIVKQELTVCVPELDLNLMDNAVICLDCANDLHTAYCFKRKCLQTEAKLQRNNKNIPQEDCNFSNILEDKTEPELDNQESEENPVQLPLLHYIDGMHFVKIEALESEYIKDSEPSEDLQNINITGFSHENTRKDIDIQYPCKICNKEFITNEFLTSHMEEHNKRDIHKCTQCNFTTFCNKELIHHVQQHADQPVTFHHGIAKRKTFTMLDKVEIIKKLESGKTLSEVSKETGLASSTVFCIWKNKGAILCAWERNGHHIKRLRKPLHADVDEALLIWFNNQMSLNIPVNRQVLKIKAVELARAMGNNDFTCSNSWLDRFKMRYNISLSKKVHYENI